MKEKVLKIIKNPYFILTVTYFAAHFLLLILSGCWWDDWTFMTHDLNYINVVASESGRPEWNFLIPFCWSLPNNGRILIFFMYLLDALFVYTAVKNCGLFDEKESLIIGLLFAVVPVDDARLLISNFSYTVGLFFFYLSLMLFMFWNRMEKSPRKILFRIGLLCLFFISFILNSVLAYYYILIGYLFAVDFRSNTENNIIKRFFISVKNVLIRYPDFFIWPFVYYGFNKTFFPTYGETFGEYNAVTLAGTLKCFIYIPLSVIKIFTDIAAKCLSCINILTAAILVLVIIVAYIIKEKAETEEIKPANAIRYLIYGLFVLVMGLLPYVMVRSREIDTMGVKGRDAVLLPLGVAIVLYAFIYLLKGKAKRVTVAVLVTLGVIGMNSLYLEWQKDYYYQLSMERLFNDSIIANNDTFFLIDLNESKIEGQRYYSLNTNAYNVFGDQTRFFIPKVSNLYILESDDAMKEAIEALGYSHMMRDYNPDDYYFDAILNYYNNLSWKEVVELKYYEMFDKTKFASEIEKRGTMEISVVDDDFTKKLLSEYNEGKLHEDEDVLDFLMEYGK